MKWASARRNCMAAALISVSLAAGAGPMAICVTIRNETDTVLQCQPLAAHWYTFPAQTLAPGQTVAFWFGFDHATAEVRGPDSALPVERLFCGQAGRAWETRGDLDLGALAARAAAAPDATAAAVCRKAGANISCRGRVT